MWFARAVFLAGAAAVSVRAGDDGDSPAASVHVLSDSVFESVVGDGSFWLVEFYAPWCGHCKKLNPILDTIAPEAHAKHGLRIGKLDAPKHKKVADRFGVKSFPTLKVRRRHERCWASRRCRVARRRPVARATRHDNSYPSLAHLAVVVESSGGPVRKQGYRAQAACACCGRAVRVARSSPPRRRCCWCRCVVSSLPCC